jgi:hypothetical protein
MQNINISEMYKGQNLKCSLNIVSIVSDEANSLFEKVNISKLFSQALLFV